MHKKDFPLLPFASFTTTNHPHHQMYACMSAGSLLHVCQCVLIAPFLIWTCTCTCVYVYLCVHVYGCLCIKYVLRAGSCHCRLWWAAVIGCSAHKAPSSSAAQIAQYTPFNNTICYVSVMHRTTGPCFCWVRRGGDSDDLWIAVNLIILPYLWSCGNMLWFSINHHNK